MSNDVIKIQLVNIISNMTCLQKCTVDLPGGPLEIEWRENNHIYMTGPAEAVFKGSAFL
mgnify:FL=1